MYIAEQKAQIAFLKVCTKLTELGYTVFVPIGEPKDVVDLISLKDTKCFRIQVKCVSDQIIKKQTNGKIRHRYSKDDFDYYGLYLSDIDKVIFPHVDFDCSNIATSVRKYGHPFWWWEDFQKFTDKNTIKKRTCNDFGIIPEDSWAVHTRQKQRKAKERPNKEELNQMLWSIPTRKIAEQYGVSDSAVSKWAKTYGLTKPPRGYWRKIEVDKNKKV